MFYSKEKYDKQVDQLLSRIDDLSKNDFEQLRYTASEGLDDGLELAEKIMKILFKHPYSNQVLVDWNFFDTPIGEVVLKIKAGSPEKIYYATDIAELLGCTVQYINREANNDNIIGEKRRKVWVFKESDVNEYLIKKGHSPIRNREENGNG